MTEAAGKDAARPRARRLSKRALRFWAWFAGAVAFFSPWAVLGLQPKPAATAAEQQRPVIIHKILRRIIVRDAPKPQPVRYVYVGGGSSSSSGGGGSTTTSGGSHP